ncbi:GNAT family N-acetyltransferase [uncultured Aquitalea sp.]|uniref:GNAT family N-acetyltransferase n=2 Tax=uncultured Aquitalea sp. TaxID=540272 RepID=UPI00341C7932
MALNPDRKMRSTTILRRLFCRLKISLEWTAFPPNCFYLTAYLCKVKVGHATGDFVAGGVFRIVTIDIYQGYRCHGYGSKIIDQLIHEAIQKNCSQLVFVGVSTSNTKAAKLYSTRYGATLKHIPNCPNKNDYVRVLP